MRKNNESTEKDTFDYDNPKFRSTGFGSIIGCGCLIILVVGVIFLLWIKSLPPMAHWDYFQWSEPPLFLNSSRTQLSTIPQICIVSHTLATRWMKIIGVLAFRTNTNCIFNFSEHEIYHYRFYFDSQFCFYKFSDQWICQILQVQSLFDSDRLILVDQNLPREDRIP